ncbi:hypothetical protein [Dongia sp.]|uniref:hypothetical protein n=1 Tax=Dongia sp. TaxID=1977262 RepID=UPI0035B30374
MKTQNKEIYFDRLGAHAQGLANVLRETFNLPSRVEGNCVFIEEILAKRRFGSRTYLSRQHQLGINDPGEDWKISETLASQVDMPQPVLAAKKLSIPADLGLVTETILSLDSLAVCEASAVAQVLSEKVIPLMRAFKATHVTCVKANLEELQEALSAIKIVCLWQHFGGERAGQMVRSGHDDPLLAPFGRAWPSCLDTLSYVDALVKFPPLALTLPVRRLNCAFHFQSEAMWHFHRVFCNGWLNEFAMAVNPMAESGHYFGLSGLHAMNEANIWRYLSFVVSSVNSLLCWLCDPSNFVDADGRIDLLRQMQTLSAVHLLFGDLSAMHHSTESHHTISFAMSLLDKLANLRWKFERKGRRQKESEYFKALCSMSEARNLKVLLRRIFDRRSYNDLGVAFEQAVDRSYEEFHSCLRRQGYDEEKDRLDLLRSQRNIRHGSFLEKEQFEKLFLNSSGAIPSTIGSITFLLVLGLVVSPELFLNAGEAEC